MRRMARPHHAEPVFSFPTLLLPCNAGRSNRLFCGRNAVVLKGGEARPASQKLSLPGNPTLDFELHGQRKVDDSPQTAAL